MDTDIPFLLSLVFVLGGLALLTYSSDLFIVASAKIARALGISPFIIGMVVIGFGTSAPELCVSTMSGIAGHSGLSIGNAYGSCIFNIAAILGISAIICPILVKRSVACIAGPILAAISILSFFLLRDGVCSRVDAAVLLSIFAVLLPLYCWFDSKTKPAEAPGSEETADSGAKRCVFCDVLKLVSALALLIGSSHLLVWGAVDMARAMGVSELTIGLTVVGIGTSLPELASAIAAARRKQHEFVLGNIVGSNFFNTLAVVGLACSLAPANGFSGSILYRDIPVMLLLSLSITLFGLSYSKKNDVGVVGRAKGLVWIASFVVYFALLAIEELSK